MRGYRGIGKIVVPALIVFVMVMGAFGTLIGPRGSPETTGGQTTTPSTRAGSIPSALSGPVTGPAGDSDSGVSGDSVSTGMAVNKDIVGRTDIRPEPLAMQYDPASGRAWDQNRQVLTLPDAAIPKNRAVSFTSSVAPTSKVLRSDPAPTAASVDAGGPYGGPDTYEGDTIVFTATVDDPNLMFFRWDFNGDGKWDTGDAASGNWVPDTTVPYQYLNMYNGLAKVEAWDGVSTTTVSYTGNILGTMTPAYYGFIYGAYTVGNRYQAKTSFTIAQLRAYRWLTYWTPVEMGLWSDGGALLGSCTLPTANPAWNACSIAPVTISSGSYFRIAVRLTTGYWMGILMSAFPSNPYVTTDGSYYSGTTGAGLIFPVYLMTSSYSTHVDFAYSYTLVTPLTVSDTARVDVSNVAPVVFDLQVSPNNVVEGSKATFTAMFYDPGLDNQWTYRWCYGDGTCDAWGGIRVGSGLSQLGKILVYSDVAPHYAALALDFFGVTYTLVTDITQLPARITSQQWDLIIYQSYYIAYIAPTIEDAMVNQIAGGALIMYNNWYALNRNTHPLMAYFGANIQSSLTTPLTMYAWDPASDLFNTPTQVPLLLNPTHNQYNVDGFRVRVLSNAFDPMGYTLNRQANQASLIVRNDKTTIFNAFTPQNYQGDQNFDGDPDMLELLVNEIRLMTGPEIPRSMPWPVPEAKHAYRDDHPVSGTPFDIFSATLEVKDSNDGKLMGGTADTLQPFASAGSWPSGWSETLGFAWSPEYSSYLASNAAVYWYYFDYSPNWHILRSQQYDLSGMDLTAPIKRVTLKYSHSWQANYPSAPYQDGLVEVSADNFATSTLVAEYHHLNPATDQGTRTFDISQFAGVSNLRVRFSIRGYDDWWWHVDNVEVQTTWGTLVVGLGSGSTQVTVNNVAPTIYGGPASGLTDEATSFAFNGYKINDPTMWDPTTGAWNPATTEWFAYRWNFDDGTMSPWLNTGTLEVPKLKVLVLNTLSFGTGDAFLNMIRGIDLVSQLDQVDFLYLAPNQLPTLSAMLQYNAVIIATNYAIFSSTFDLTRRTIGDRLADYQDLGGAVITFMATYDLSGSYGELFSLLGRYIDEDYGAFEKTTYLFGAGALGQVLQPSHPVMSGITRLTSPLIVSGDYPLTAGAQLLARWDNGNAAVGVKERANGARSVNVGSFSGSGSSICGGQCQQFIRNSIMWAGRVSVPTNEIPSFSHVYGDNGLYNVDLSVIDDDMGWSWDAVANAPVPIAGLPQTMSHAGIPVNVNNVDPVIDTKSVEAFIAADVCLRVSGDTWNTVSLGFFVDGVKTGGATVLRAPGSPNDQAKCTFAKLDLLAPHVFSTQLDYAPAQGDTSGTNDWWVIIAPWREPITPGHGTVTYKGQSKVEDPSTYTTTIALPTLKMDLVDAGRGAPIEVAATATDPGTDDLGFVWIWGDGAPDTVNIHNNAGGGVSAGAIGNPQLIGFSEPFFSRAANSGRSPYGTAPFTARDFATHSFSGSGPYLWVVLIVLDDDNTRGYPSPGVHDGTDTEFLVLDLT